MNCPKCDADISESFEEADFSCGILSGGWFCDACDLAIGEHEVDREPMEGDIQISGTAGEPRGTPLSELSGQPGDPRDQNDPRHAGYEKFKRIAKSWGYD
jgi:hypothetical protein